jgi:EAL domain-containing protein (putative c-di-GMP-specific phosphodiesterase class I)
VRLLSSRSHHEERLIWSRDIRFIHALAARVPSARQIELEAGSCLIGPGTALTDVLTSDVARENRGAEFGLVTVDQSLPVAYRYVVALSSAVQVSGLADRIGMAQTTQAIQTKTLDYFFSLKNNHEVHFQPIVELSTGRLEEFECLFRPIMPMLPQTVSAIVQAAVDTGRSVELDSFIVRRILQRVQVVAAMPAGDVSPDLPSPLQVAINFTPASLLEPRFEASALADLVAEHGLSPDQIIVECTEQQAVSDVVPLKRQVKALRRLGFGFAVDDAGAGYASFTLIAALRPSIIKIDKEIVTGIRLDDAKQALVEAFVSFGRRIGAHLVAEGIETRSDLATLVELGVEFGQGYLIGKPDAEPIVPRRGQVLRLAGVRERFGGQNAEYEPEEVAAAAD